MGELNYSDIAWPTTSTRIGAHTDTGRLFTSGSAAIATTGKAALASRARTEDGTARSTSETPPCHRLLPQAERFARVDTAGRSGPSPESPDRAMTHSPNEDIDWDELWQQTASRLQDSAQRGLSHVLTEDSLRWSIIQSCIEDQGVNPDRLAVEEPSPHGGRIDLVLAPDMAALELKYPGLLVVYEVP